MATVEEIVLICPQCRFENRAGLCRIGNRRSVCNTCNAFAAAVRRTALNELRDKHPAEFEQLQQKALLAEYRVIVAKFNELNPEKPS